MMPFRMNPRPQNKYTWESEEIPHRFGAERIYHLRENDRAPSTNRNGHVEWDVRVIMEESPEYGPELGGSIMVSGAQFAQYAVRDLEEAGIEFIDSGLGHLIVPLPGDVYASGYSGKYLMQRTEHKNLEAAKKHALDAFLALKNKIEKA